MNITGRGLFNLYVMCGLCVDSAYSWDMLSYDMQQRWNEMARQLRTELAE